MLSIKAKAKKGGGDDGGESFDDDDEDDIDADGRMERNTRLSSSNAAIDIAIDIADDGSTTTRDGVGSTHEAEEDLTTRCVEVCGGCAVAIDVRDDSAMGPPPSVEEGTRHDMEGGHRRRSTDGAPRA